MRIGKTEAMRKMAIQHMTRMKPGDSMVICKGGDHTVITRGPEQIEYQPDPIITEAVKETVQLMESKGLVIKKIKHLGNVT